MRRNFFVLGGAGAMGRVVVRDLLASHPRNRVFIADFQVGAARAYAAALRSARVTAGFADARRTAALAACMRGFPVVINCTQHHFNLLVMEAALRAGAHYLDLGGLFVWTRRQLKWHGRFARAGRMAILGVGGSPGITNVMARAAASGMERVDVIKVRSGWAGSGESQGDLSFGFSAQTVLEELTLPAWVFKGGRFRTVAPRSRWERVVFPPPFGAIWCLCTRHSEVATLPDAFRKAGCRACDFRLGYDRGFVREVIRRLASGWTVADFRALTASREGVDDAEILRVEVRGRRAGARKPESVIMDCTSRAKPAWQASAGDINTGCPPSIIAQMVVDGRIPRRPGVWSPERVVPPRPFFAELEQRGLRVIRRRAVT